MKNARRAETANASEPSKTEGGSPNVAGGLIDDQLYDFNETGRWLGGASHATLRRFVARGELEAIKVGSQVRFRGRVLRRFMDNAPAARFRQASEHPAA